MSSEPSKPAPDNEAFSRLRAELLRVEEDCTHSSKSHFNAADRWGKYNLYLGVPSIILSVAAGKAFFASHPGIAGIMSGAAGVLTALITFLKPAERSAAHKTAGDHYLALRNECRFFREVEIEISAAKNLPSGIIKTNGFAKRRNDLNKSSPQFSDQDRRLARKGIEEGEATHIVDAEKN